MNDIYAYLGYLADKYNIDTDDIDEFEACLQSHFGGPAETIELNFDNDEANYEDEGED